MDIRSIVHRSHDRTTACFSAQSVLQQCHEVPERLKRPEARLRGRTYGDRTDFGSRWIFFKSSQAYHRRTVAVS
jgi:hypothetical protein